MKKKKTNLGSSIQWVLAIIMAVLISAMLFHKIIYNMMSKYSFFNWNNTVQGILCIILLIYACIMYMSIIKLEESNLISDYSSLGYIYFITLVPSLLVIFKSIYDIFKNYNNIFLTTLIIVLLVISDMGVLDNKRQSRNLMDNTNIGELQSCTSSLSSSLKNNTNSISKSFSASISNVDKSLNSMTKSINYSKNRHKSNISESINKFNDSINKTKRSNSAMAIDNQELLDNLNKILKELNQ